MADERKIVIELKVLGSGDGESKETGEPENKEKELSSKEKAKKSAIKQTVNWAFNEIESQVMYQVGLYCSLTDDYKTQLILNNVETTVNKVKGLASSAISGALIGAKIGVGPGAAIGAAIGVGMDIISEGLSIARQYDQQKLNLAMTDRQTQYMQSRLGLIDNGRGTQN